MKKIVLLVVLVCLSTLFEGCIVVEPCCTTQTHQPSYYGSQHRTSSGNRQRSSPIYQGTSTAASSFDVKTRFDGSSDLNRVLESFLGSFSQKIRQSLLRNYPSCVDSISIHIDVENNKLVLSGYAGIKACPGSKAQRRFDYLGAISGGVNTMDTARITVSLLESQNPNLKNHSLYRETLEAWSTTYYNNKQYSVFLKFFIGP